jgi:hypothetical protein
MGTTEKLKFAKELFATSFLVATEKSMADGMQFKYNSYLQEQEDDKEGKYSAWHIDIIVKEAGHGEKTLQQFRFLKPSNIDSKNMELHAIIETFALLTQGAISMWYEVGKMLATDNELQLAIIDETKKNNIASY